MSRESYIKGFCKVAEGHGVDPVQLAKFAAEAVVGNENKEGTIDAYHVPRDFSGSTDWLGSTNALNIVGSPDGVWRTLPGGTASLTNSPNATIRKIDYRTKPATTNDIPVWKPGRVTLGDALYGMKTRNVPSSDKVREFLEYLSAVYDSANKHQK